MSVKVRCPQCNTTLTAPNDIIGQTVRCEECEATFTAKKPALRPPVVDADEAPVRPSKTNTRRLADDDDEDDRPRKKRRHKKSSTNAAPLIFGGLLAMSLIVVVIFLGYYFVRSPKSAQQQAVKIPAQPQPMFQPNGFAPLPNNVGVAPAQAPPIVGDKIRISNARWGGSNRMGGFPTQGDFTYDYECLFGRPVAGQFRIQCKNFDGSTISGVLNSMVNLSGTQTMKPSMFSRWRQQSMEFWIEENGTRVSNILTLN